MPFPTTPRVVYDSNPLEEVICQVRFPTILRIDSEPPAAFQDKVRESYQVYKEKPTFTFPDGFPLQITRLLTKDLQLPLGQVTHEFASDDDAWLLALNRDFLALTCRRYDRWEKFKGRFADPLAALQEVYSPSFFTRVGLRYKNVIRRSRLGLGEAGWADLLIPPVAGVLASGDAAVDVVHTANEIVVRLPGQLGMARIHHGLALDAESGESCYLIDCDLFDDQRTETIHALEKLDSFHRRARDFFRWCITDRLHEAMGPRAP